MIRNFSLWDHDTECPLDGYKAWKKALIDASFHFADDSAKEWGTARRKLVEACEIAIAKGWPYWVQQRMWNESGSFLMPWEYYMEAYVKLMHSKLDEAEDEMAEHKYYDF